MSSETAQIRNLLTPMNTLADFIGHDEFDERYAKPMADQVKANVNKIVGELKVIDETRFAVDEFKKYLSKQDSFDDAFYNLKPENVKNAQSSWCKDCERYAKCQEVFDQPEVNGGTVACPQYDGK